MATESLTDALEDTLSVFEESGAPRTTTEVAERLDLGRRSAYDRLDRLVDRGHLETKKVGAAGRVWWQPASTSERSSGASAGSERVRGSDREQLESLIDAVEDYAIFVLDRDGYVRSWNPGVERIKGYEADEIVGEHFSTFYTDTDREAGVPEENLAAADAEGSIEDEGWRVRADGSRFWANVTISAIRGDGGDLRGYAKVTRDMTERREHERRLSRQAERHQRQRDDLAQELDDVFERVDDAFYALDSEFRFEYVNDRAETYLDTPASDLLGREVWEALDVEDEEPIVETFETAMATQEPASFERYSDTLGIWLTVHVYPGDSGLSVYFTDITERKETESALRRSEERFRTLMEYSPISMQVFDAEGSPVATNPAWERLWDASREELADYNILQDEQLAAAGLLTPIEEAFAGEVVTLPVIHYDPAEIDKPGRARWVEGYAYPLVEDDEQITEVAIVHHDITELKERERDLELYETIVETVTDGVYAVDPEYRFTMVNEAYTDMVGYDRETLLGSHISTVVGDGVASIGEQLRENLRDGTDDRGSIELEIETVTGEEITVETRYSLLPSDGDFVGTAGVVRDVTERKQREQELELYKTIVDTIDDGVYVLDEEFCFLEVNDRYAEMTGYDREELLGEHCTLVIDEAVSAESAERLQEVITGDAESATLEADILRADGSRLRAESNFTAIETTATDRPLKVGVVRDVSERVARERELEEFRRWTQTLIENFPAGAVALVDSDFRYVSFAGSPEGETDLTAADLAGRNVRDVLPEQIADVVVPGYEAALEGDPSEFEETVDDRVYQFHFVPVRDEDGEVFAATAMSQDITEQKERERRLREAKLQMEVATEAGAVGTWEWNVEEDRFVAGPSFARMFGVDPEAAHEGVSLDRFASAIHEDDRDRVMRNVDGAVSSCDEYEEEYRVWNAEGEIRWVVARGHTECDDEGNPVTFPGILVDITDRKRAELELAALNSLNEVFRDITDAVIEQSTREEIETVVCEGLAAADSFSFAWIGEVDPATKTLEPRVEAGTEGYVDGMTVSVDPEDERSRGPGGQAVITGEVQIARDTQADEEFAPWRDRAESYNVRSSAAVPITYDDRTYGLLNVYAGRPDAFAAAERRVLGQLGEVVGHAIAAVERKRALMSDEIVELEFFLEDAFSALGVDATSEGRITLDQAVPTSGEEFLVYGTATEAARPALEELVGALAHWKEITDLGVFEGRHRFELRVSEPPVLSTVAARGGYVESVRIEDGDAHLVVHLPPTANVRAIVDAVDDAYPAADLLANRQISRTGEMAAQLERLLEEGLTERQRSALEVAFHTGFFEWPRETTGEEVAASLGVSPPTFHQHLRKAERKVLQSVLSATAPG